MAQKLGFFSQWMIGEWGVINRNADELTSVGYSVSDLQRRVQLQGQEILRLRAMIMGVVEVLYAKAPFDDAELERAVQAAWLQITAPPPSSPSPPVSSMTDPYRGTPVAAIAPPARLVVCTQCGLQVSASKTIITEHGEVCDACS